MHLESVLEADFFDVSININFSLFRVQINIVPRRS